MTKNKNQVVLNGGPNNGDLVDAPEAGKFLQVGSAVYGPYDGYAPSLVWKPVVDGNEEF